MAEINLLPVDLSPNRGSVKIGSFIKRIALILTGIILFASVLEVIFVVFLLFQIRASTTRQQVLKQNISALQSTEQKFFLIKDRIEKIQKAFSEKNAGASFNSLNQILAHLPQDVVVDGVTVDTVNTKFSVISKSSLGMAAFLNSLVVDGTYKNLVLKNFIFSPDNGYLVTLQGT